MVTVYDVANYFLAKTDPELGDAMTNLKLQKMVYYAQGFSLALYGKPLFADPIEAWEHGPVCPVLYRKYKTCKANSIKPEKTIEEATQSFTKQQRELLDNVQDSYGCYSAWALRDISHQDTAWHNAFPNGTISLEAMKESCQARLDPKS